MDEMNLSKLTEYLINQLPKAAKYLGYVILAIVIYFISAKIINKICRLIRQSMVKAGVDIGASQFVSSFLKAVLYCIIVLSIAVKFGIETSSVAALLASGGVGIGLALQGGLSNLAGGVIILLVKPFQVGDYIIENADRQEGTVTKIEMFYTTLTTMDNRRITVPNGKLTNSSIVNVTSQDKRKLEFKVGISYQADLRKAKQILEKILNEDDQIMSEDEMIVFVDQLAESSVILGFRAWVKTDEYWHTKWRLNEKVKFAFDQGGIEIPYPQMDVRINQRVKQQ